MLDEMKVLSRIAPDLMADIGRRAQVLSSIESMQPVGRRALAARLNLPEDRRQSPVRSLPKPGLAENASLMLPSTARKSGFSSRR